MKKTTLAIGGLVAGCLVFLGAIRAEAEPFTRGAKSCQECHQPEFEIWEKTQHAAGYKDLHRRDAAKGILEGFGEGRNPRRIDACVSCHYTSEQDSPDDRASIRSAVTCEKCHGAASEWIAIHNDYGGPAVSRTMEDPAHKAKRIEDCVAAGMIRPDRHFDVAANCLECHGVQRLDGPTIDKLLAAGHPIKADFELVQYSQGGVRHRFYPPDMSKNAEMTPAELARWFVTGQAANLVQCTTGLAKSQNDRYQAVLKEQIAKATAALGKLTDVPEAAALLQQPTEENARALVKAIGEKDLQGAVGGMLPAAGTYK